MAVNLSSEAAEIARSLCAYADAYGVVQVLGRITPHIKVRIPIGDKSRRVKIEEIPVELSVRSRNGMMRSGSRTVGDIVDLIQNGDAMNNIRNLGKKSINEIKSVILEYLYSELTDAERIAFWNDTVAQLLGITA